MSVIVSGTEDAARVAAVIRRYLSHEDIVEADGADAEELRQMAADLEAEIPTMHQTRHEAYYQLVLGLLRLHNGNVSAAARQADTDRKHFHTYVERFAIDLTAIRPGRLTRNLVRSALRKRKKTEARQNVG